jgi:hypothetical protein
MVKFGDELFEFVFIKYPQPCQHAKVTNRGSAPSVQQFLKAEMRAIPTCKLLQ